MMKMAKAEFTPGPWRIVKVFGKCKRRILSEQGSVLADIHNRREFQERGGVEMKANAALIAAAPDLLAAIEAINHVTKGGYCICPCADGNKPDANHSTGCADVRAAIAKARGQ
jgi:hypothetical protein